jgi:hypothetical protein
VVLRTRATPADQSSLLAAQGGNAAVMSRTVRVFGPRNNVGDLAKDLPAGGHAAGVAAPALAAALRYDGGQAQPGRQVVGAGQGLAWEAVSAGAISAPRPSNSKPAWGSSCRFDAQLALHEVIRSRGVLNAWGTQSPAEA